jgi:hypothetical protein
MPVVAGDCMLTIRRTDASGRRNQQARCVVRYSWGGQNRDIAGELGASRVRVARWREQMVEVHEEDRAGNAKDQVLHLICDNYATHKHPKVIEWPDKHPRFHVHFTPTSASRPDMVERFFRDIITERLRRGAFTGVPELLAAIDAYIARHNTRPQPFIWTASARGLLQKDFRANSRLGSKQNATLRPGGWQPEAEA